MKFEKNYMGYGKKNIRDAAYAIISLTCGIPALNYYSVI